MPSIAARFAPLLALPLGGLAVSPAQADDIPNLVGEWHGTYNTLVYHDDATHTGKATLVLTISRQEGELIFASHTWELHEDNPGQPDVAGEVVRGGDETLIGVVHFDDDDVTLLETHDNGIFELELERDNVMEGIYHEQGHHEAAIFRVRLTRQD